MDKRLFVTDLDGTLLNSNMTLTNYTIDTLNDLIKKGMKITYSTSRSFYTTSMILQKIQFALPCITFNGAHIINPLTKKTIKKNLLDNDFCDEIIARSQKFHFSPYIFGITKQQEEKLIYDKPNNEAQEKFIQERINRNDKRLHLKPKKLRLKEIINLSFLYPIDKIAQLKEIILDFSNNVSIKIMDDIYCKGYQTLEVSHLQANKGDALKHLCKINDIELKNVSVFGDQMNDIDMFKIAGVKIAVANAADEIKKFADIVIKKNDEDGVARFLSDLYNKK